MKYLKGIYIVLFVLLLSGLTAMELTNDRVLSDSGSRVDNVFIQESSFVDGFIVPELFAEVISCLSVNYVALNSRVTNIFGFSLFSLSSFKEDQTISLRKAPPIHIYAPIDLLGSPINRYVYALRRIRI